MSKRNFYEMQLRMVMDKMYEQEVCLRNTTDIFTQLGIRVRIAGLEKERKQLMETLRNM